MTNSNVPILAWESGKNLAQAKNQIMHQEPLILQFDQDFIMPTQVESEGCEADTKTGMVLNCSGEKVFLEAATTNRMDELRELAKICKQSGSQVDVDRNRHRLVVHD